MIQDTAVELPQYKKSDFSSDQDTRWCPGCGDYAILSTVQKTLAGLGVAKEKHVFISGIGCSSRFPYYMDTYGFHTIHGRAPTIASGLKCANPELNVWVVTGDGDALSIGGNHLIHCLRRNLNINILLVNNQIYGLTKGQYSPTSPAGKIAPSSPFGSIDRPVNPIAIALASECGFVARAVDSNAKQLGEILRQAHAHNGSSFVEIYQNCVVFNKDCYEPVVGKNVRDEHTIWLEDGAPLKFGAKKDKAIIFDGWNPLAVRCEDIADTRIPRHNLTEPSPTYAYMLAHMEHPKLPVPFGVFRSTDRPAYEAELERQIREGIAAKGEGDLRALIHGAETWVVSE